MRAFLIILVVLVILSGAAFYFGWIQILLPAEHYAVLFTKTGGYDEAVIRPGEFVWRWERLIPTNATLLVFDLHPYVVELPVQGTLPSAELYSSILPENPDFRFSGTVSAEFSIKPESLPQLVRSEKLTPDRLEQYYQQVGREIAGEIVAELAGTAPETLAAGTLDRELAQTLAARFPDLDLLRLSTGELHIPDLQLYDLARRSYRELVAVRDTARDEEAARLAVQQVRTESVREKEKATLETLREYGKLFDEYPILLKAMYVQKLSGSQLATLPEFDLNKILESSGSE